MTVIWEFDQSTPLLKAFFAFTCLISLQMAEIMFQKAIMSYVCYSIRFRRMF